MMHIIRECNDYKAKYKDMDLKARCYFKSALEQYHQEKQKEHSSILLFLEGQLFIVGKILGYSDEEIEALKESEHLKKVSLKV